MASSDIPQQKSRLRRYICRQRAGLPISQRRAAAQRLAQQLRQHPSIRPARRIGLYAGTGGELDPLWFANWWGRDKQFYLPVIHTSLGKHLSFVVATSPWRYNRYGIKEPRFSFAKCCPLWQLDVLLMPLVAFDRKGGRLGMGAGFYDRTLSNLPSWAKRPTCIGIGYRFQETSQLPLAPHDVLIDAVVTD